MNGAVHRTGGLHDISAPFGRAEPGIHPVHAASEQRLLPTAAYVQRLRPLLPREAFRPSRKKLWIIALHLAVVALAYGVIRASDALLLHIGVAILLGHSLVCLAFLAHELSHGAIIQKKQGRYFLELLVWGLVAMPPTIWRKVHNESHHRETNTAVDPDRLYRKSEATLARRIAGRIFMPNRAGVRWRPTVLLGVPGYTLRNVFAALSPTKWNPPFVVARPRYSGTERLRIVIELVAIVGLMVLAFHAVGGTWNRFLWAVPVPLLVSSCIATIYIFTNHLLNSFCEHTDPVLGSTSIEVPAWMNWLHSNFSYHTEHHLFPSISSDNYPLVCEALKQQFPARYNRVPIWTAWRQLWRTDEFIRERAAPADAAQPHSG